MITYNGRQIWKNGFGLNYNYVPPTPPGPSLPPYTIRLKFKDDVTPTFSKGTGVQVSSSPNIWDLTYENTNWVQLLSHQTDLIEVIAANTSSVVYMNTMFTGCSALTTVSLFDTSSVTNMNSMFSSCSSLTTVPLFNTSSATNMGYMFNGCTSLTTVPLFNTSSATNMSTMFRSCTSLTTVPLFNTSSVTNMGTMFYGCTGLTTVPLFNTSSATSMGSMFYGCTGLTTVPLFNTSSVTIMTSMFYNCVNVQSGALALYQQASSQATPPRKYSSAFYNCGSNTVTGVAELAQIPSDWK